MPPVPFIKILSENTLNIFFVKTNLNFVEITYHTLVFCTDVLTLYPLHGINILSTAMFRFAGLVEYNSRQDISV